MTHTLAGAYVLNALSDEERREFEAHLAGCETCAEEIQGLRETAARLGMAAARPAPDGLRARVLAEAGRTRQEPPRLRDVRAARFRRAGPALLAAASLVLAALFGAGWFGAERRADQVEARERRTAAREAALNAVLSAPDAVAVTASVRDGGRGTVVMSRSHDRAVVVMSGIPRAPHAHTYALWLMGAGVPEPVGTMERAAGPVMIDNVGRARQVGITIEPAGGSPAPTTRPIFAAELPA
ncbi:anti-sigma factor [Actinomadura flavalba]|uniref:anti-sigma factor n=1 Tax=Actinomadura flavalba TaxID=1120938 RepID=UPI00036BAA26|nr:anti-sigma factor [Actinomadura flavalba]